MHCTSNCQQGRAACPCPQACEVAESHNERRAFWLAYVVFVAVIAVAAGLAVLP